MPIVSSMASVLFCLILTITICVLWLHTHPPEPYGREEKIEAIFNDVYRTAYWGTINGTASSGGGSFIEFTVQYRKFLEKFFKHNKIKSVLDVGCGRWSFPHLIDWGPVEKYIGIDIVESNIEFNKQRFSSLKLKPIFRHMSLTSDNLPCADLLITKDVMQHLPLHECLSIINFALNKRDRPNKCHFKHLLITNDITLDAIYNSDFDITSLERPPTVSRNMSLNPFFLKCKEYRLFPYTPDSDTIKITQHVALE